VIPTDKKIMTDLVEKTVTQVLTSQKDTKFVLLYNNCVLMVQKATGQITNFVVQLMDVLKGRRSLMGQTVTSLVLTIQT